MSKTPGFLEEAVRRYASKPIHANMLHARMLLMKHSRTIRELVSSGWAGRDIHRGLVGSGSIPSCRYQTFLRWCVELGIVIKEKGNGEI